MIYFLVFDFLFREIKNIGPTNQRFFFLDHESMERYLILKTQGIEHCVGMNDLKFHVVPKNKQTKIKYF